MRRRCRPAAPLALASLLALAAMPAQASDSTLPDWGSVRVVDVAADLAGPVDFDFAPDGSVWFVEVYAGNVVRLDPSTGDTKVMHHVDIVAEFDERGLVGLALDPDFATTKAFFIFYTAPTSDPDGGENRVSRVADGEEQILLRFPAFKRHNGGRLEFAPDKTLFVGVGDNEKQGPAQDPQSPLGKVLRITRDGRPAPDNPWDTAAFDLGHRNIYGLAVHPRTGQLYQTENSGWRRDEINIVEAGKNYGYPACEGFSLANKDDPCPAQYEPPILEVYHTKTAAPTGATWFLGQFFWASWNEGSVHHSWLDDDQHVWKDKQVYDTDGRIADLETGPDGRTLWYSTWDSLHRLEFPSLPPGVESRFMPEGWKPPPKGRPANPPPSDGGIIPGATGTSPENPTPAPALALAAAAIAASAFALRRRR